MVGLDPGLRRDGHGEQRVHTCESSVRRPIGEEGLEYITRCDGRWELRHTDQNKRPNHGHLPLRPEPPPAGF
jgi:hypothetical protein